MMHLQYANTIYTSSNHVSYVSHTLCFNFFFSLSVVVDFKLESDLYVLSLISSFYRIWQPIQPVILVVEKLKNWLWPNTDK